MKPIIGITSGIKDESLVMTAYDNIHAIVQAGGVPMVLPNLADEQLADRLLEQLDGLLATGGGDIDPTLFGEEPHPKLGEVSPLRDQFELMIVRKALQANKPVLGICRGCQILNVAAGGTVYQDIYSQCSQELLQHAQRAPRAHASHFVDIEEETMFYEIIQMGRIKVNSYHHQAVHRVADGFRVSAAAGDEIIEAIESTRHAFALGVQWHPENMTGRDPYADAIFKAFVDACSKG